MINFLSETLETRSQWSDTFKKEYYEQLYTNKLDTLKEMDKFLETNYKNSPKKNFKISTAL